MALKGEDEAFLPGPCRSRDKGEKTEHALEAACTEGLARGTKGKTIF